MSHDKSFGKLLRAARHKAFDDERGKKLTQERLGELIGQKLGITGYTGAMISYWENNNNQINKDDREVLVSLIKVLHECRGLPTAGEANELLWAGNYRGLSEKEEGDIFGTKPDVPSEPPDREAPETTNKLNEKEESLPPEEPSEPEIFVNIWYTTKELRFYHIRNPDLGTLFVHSESAEYRGEKEEVILRDIISVLHTRQGGEVNNNWVKVEYGDPENRRVAYFSDAKRLGFGTLFGGSKPLFKALLKLVKGTSFDQSKD